MGNMDIQIIKSRRRTVSIEVHTDGSVILRAPNRITKKELDIFIDKHMQCERQGLSSKGYRPSTPHRQHQ